MTLSLSLTTSLSLSIKLGRRTVNTRTFTQVRIIRLLNHNQGCTHHQSHHKNTTSNGCSQHKIRLIISATGRKNNNTDKSNNS